MAVETVINIIVDHIESGGIAIRDEQHQSIPILEFNKDFNPSIPFQTFVSQLRGYFHTASEQKELNNFLITESKFCNPRQAHFQKSTIRLFVCDWLSLCSRYNASFEQVFRDTIHFSWKDPLESAMSAVTTIEWLTMLTVGETATILSQNKKKVAAYVKARLEDPKNMMHAIVSAALLIQRGTVKLDFDLAISYHVFYPALENLQIVSTDKAFVPEIRSMSRELYRFVFLQTGTHKSELDYINCLLAVQLETLNLKFRASKTEIINASTSNHHVVAMWGQGRNELHTDEIASYELLRRLEEYQKQCKKIAHQKLADVLTSFAVYLATHLRVRVFIVSNTMCVVTHDDCWTKIAEFESKLQPFRKDVTETATDLYYNVQLEDHIAYQFRNQDMFQRAFRVMLRFLAGKYSFDTPDHHNRIRSTWDKSESELSAEVICTDARFTDTSIAAQIASVIYQGYCFVSDTGCIVESSRTVSRILPLITQMRTQLETTERVIFSDLMDIRKTLDSSPLACVARIMTKSMVRMNEFSPPPDTFSKCVLFVWHWLAHVNEKPETYSQMTLTVKNFENKRRVDDWFKNHVKYANEFEQHSSGVLRIFQALAAAGVSIEMMSTDDWMNQNEMKARDMPEVDKGARSVPADPASVNPKKDDAVTDKSSSTDKSAGTETSRLCVVCQNASPNLLIVPCHHLCMCQSCCEQMYKMDGVKKACPVCRGNIEKFVLVY